MSSGNRSMLFNLRERAISNDHNRLQSFQDRMLLQVLRRMVIDQVQVMGAPANAAEGSSTEYSTVESPLRAVVLNGLLVIPGTTSCTVKPGTLAAIDDALANGLDDSPCVYCDSAGLAAGTITFTDNGGGGDRIDVIECSLNMVVVETDSRDVFDPSTGLFTPTLVDKVKEAQLTFRIRLGTPGSGYPGHASGWLPLAVVNTPNTAASFADCTFWDVRPLLSDRADGITNEVSPVDGGLKGYASVKQADQHLEGLVTTVGMPTGNASGAEYARLRIGGRLRRTAPGGDDAHVDLGDPDNVSPGFGGFASSPGWGLYAVFPEGLPRWCRYAQSAATTGGERLPWGPLGLMVVEDWAPNLARYRAVQLPSLYGLGSGTHPGHMVMAGRCDTGSANSCDMTFRDGVHRVEIPIDQTTANGDSSDQQFTFAANTFFPYGAKSILCSVEVAIDTLTSDTHYAVRESYDFGASGVVASKGQFAGSHHRNSANARIYFGHEVRLDPYYPDWPELAAPLTQTLNWHLDWIVSTPSSNLLSQSCKVYGWEL